MNSFVLIGFLSLSTFLSRILGVEVMAKQKMNPILRQYFSYVSVAIISSLIVSQIINTVDGGLVISFPVLLGCVATAVAIQCVNSFIPSVVFGIMVGLLVRYFLVM